MDYSRNSTSEMMSKLYEHESVNKSNYSCAKNVRENEQKLTTVCRDNDRGDIKVHGELSPKSVIYQHPECLAGEEYQMRVNPSSTYPCSREAPTSCVKTSPCTSGSIQFTQKMIEDQEMLVSSLSQQGISEPLIRRHFERLLEEQSKQLHMLNESRLAEQKKSKIDLFKFKKQSQKRNKYEAQEKSYGNINYNSVQATDKPNCACAAKVTANNTLQSNHEQQCVRRNEEESKIADDSQECSRPHKVEPSSLMKIRFQKELVNTHKRNNGLQNDAVALEIIQNCKSEKGKQVPHNHSSSPLCVRLNGTQDKQELKNYQAMYAPESLKILDKQTPYNGLENTRNPDNPQSAPKSLRCRAQQFESDITGASYPSQRSYYHCPTAFTSASNHNAGKYSDNYRCSNDAEPPAQFENEPPAQPTNDLRVDECNPTECANNQSNLRYWPEFHEPKIIGGLTYFARKPQSASNRKILNLDSHVCPSMDH